MEIEILVFECEQRYFGVEARFVREVLRAVSLTPVPKAPKVVMGLVNLRGHVLPVLDTKHLLGLGECKIQTTDHLVVVDTGKCEIALHVDRAVDLLRISPDSGDEQEQESKDQQSAEEDHLVHHRWCSIAKTHMGVVQVLDPSRLFSHDTMKEVLDIAASIVAKELSS